jgi:hypothetical protein
MVKIARDRIERAFRNAWRASFLKDIKASLAIVILLVVGLGLIALFYLQPLRSVGVVEARPLGIHQAQWMASHPA